MANILVYIELLQDRPQPASLEALGEGRRMASSLGASLCAVVPCAAPPAYPDGDIIALLGRHGADKVILVVSPDLAGPQFFGSIGAALPPALAATTPLLVLFAATPAGRDMAPRVAASMGAAFVAEPAVEYGPRGEIVLSRTLYANAVRRRLNIDDIERPVVVTLTPGSYRTALGDDEADVVVLKHEGGPGPLRVVDEEPDPGLALDAARVVVGAGAGVAAADLDLLRRLAAAFGGEVAMTRSFAAAGAGGPHRVVGIGGRPIAPRLYFAVGASGSSEHLAGLSADTQVVAINQDAAAPIFRVAAYGIVGDYRKVVVDLLAAMPAPAPKPAAAHVDPEEDWG